MATGERDILVGVFDDREHAQNAVNELKRAGFTDEQIGVASREREEREPRGEGQESYTEEGAVTGAVAGAGIGGLWALGIAAGALPGIGPIIAGGLLASLLASAAVGAVVGGLAGALIGLGVPEEEAQYYEEEFKAGRTIVTVKAAGRFAEARDILDRFGAYDINSRPTMARTAEAEEGRTIQAREEQLRAEKEMAETGEVRVHKDVETEQRTMEVPVSKEEVVIERHPVEGREAPAGEIREGEEVRVPVSEEQVHVEKQPVVTEEVTVGKRETKDTERVSGMVRKEDIDIEKRGDVDIREERR